MKKINFYIDKPNTKGTIHNTEILCLKGRGSSVVEHAPEERSVGGSIPLLGTISRHAMHYGVL